MNIEATKAVVVKTTHRGLLLTKKHSPAILTGAGIVGGVAAAVLGARATLHLEEIVDETNANIERVKTEAHLQDLDVNSKTVGLQYVKGGLKVAKLYGPAVSLGLVSIGAIVSGHVVLDKRNVALMGAYAGLERTYNEYRKRVEEAVGEEKEREIRVGDISQEKLDALTKDMSSTEAKSALHSTAAHVSPYARFFDEFSSSWSGDPEQNKIFLIHQQNYFNDMLHTRGHVFLNDVHRALGLTETSAGQLVGWVHDPEGKGPGDNIVDFGIFKKDSQSRLFVAGDEKSILLDFNVDGVVYDIIGEDRYTHY